MRNKNFRSLLPYGIAIVVFLIITLVYLSPLLEGRKLWQSDIAQHLGASKEIADYRAGTGEEPLWTNSMFGGMPAYQVSTVYKGNLLGYLDKAITLGLPTPANLLFLYLIGFFFLLLAMRVGPWLAIAGAIAFAFSSFFFIIIEVGHNSQAHAIGYMAPVIAGMILTFRRHYLWGGIMTAVFLSLEVKANHPQITYYLAMIALLLGLFKLIHAIRFKEVLPFLKSAGILVIALVFAILTNITTLWATWEYGKFSIRGKSELASSAPGKTTGLDKDYITQYSYGIGETMTLLIPGFRGGASAGLLKEKSEIVNAMRANGVGEETVRQYINQPIPYYYWGDQFSTAGPVYVGAIVCFLFLLGLLIVKGPIKWWLLGATIISILLAWGHNLMAVTDFFIHCLPGYNKFRAVTMTLVIAEFAMPLLGILAVRDFFESKDRKWNLKALEIAYAVTGGITLFFTMFPSMLLDFTGPRDQAMAAQLPGWFMDAIRLDRMDILKMDALRGFIFISLTAALLWAVLLGKVKTHLAIAGLALLILTDMFVINKRFLNNDSFTTVSKAREPFQPGPADLQILSDKDPNFRVFNLTVDPFSDASTSYFHKSIGGYSGVKMRRYQELIENQIRKQNMAVLNMLNTKYFIVPDENRQPVAQLNPEALGNAWFVRSVMLVENADAELQALTGFNPDSVAVVDKKYSDQLALLGSVFDSTDYIAPGPYAPNHLTYRYSARGNRLAVFSEIYYPRGWNAYVDGKPAPYFRANFVLRAMALPAGEHQVEFRFEPVVYSTGEKISRVSSILLIVIVVSALGAGFFRFRKNANLLLMVAVILVAGGCSGPVNSERNVIESDKDRGLDRHFGWLIGSWIQSSSAGDFIETWEIQNDSVFSGHGFQVVRGDTLFSERMILVSRSNGYFYIPVVSDQNNGLPVTFNLISMDGKTYIFENKDHDFPQQIIYEDVAPDSLRASIKGIANGKHRVEVFRMKRMTK
jgi:hypothetical protein